jgi:hypothetical protein
MKALCLRCAFGGGAHDLFFRPSDWNNITICRALAGDEQMGVLLPPPGGRGHEGPMIDFFGEITASEGQPGPHWTVGLPSICRRDPGQGASI